MSFQIPREEAFWNTLSLKCEGSQSFLSTFPRVKLQLTLLSTNEYLESLMKGKSGRAKDPPLTSIFCVFVSLPPISCLASCNVKCELSNKAGVSPGNIRAIKTAASVSDMFKAFLAMVSSYCRKKYNNNFRKFASECTITVMILETCKRAAFLCDYSK